MTTAESGERNVIRLVVYCLNPVPLLKVVARWFQEHGKVPLVEVLQLGPERPGQNIPPLTTNS